MGPLISFPSPFNLFSLLFRVFAIRTTVVASDDEAKCHKLFVVVSKPAWTTTSLRLSSRGPRTVINGPRAVGTGHDKCGSTRVDAAATGCHSAGTCLGENGRADPIALPRRHLIAPATFPRCEPSAPSPVHMLEGRGHETVCGADNVACGAQNVHFPHHALQLGMTRREM